MSGTLKTLSPFPSDIPDAKLVALEVATVGDGIANASVASGKSAADDVAYDGVGIANP